MMRTLLSLWLLLQTLFTSLPTESRTVFAMKTGVLLRMHVVAQDDTAEMQRVKLCVRDAVQAAYAAAPHQDGTMLQRTQALLPQLTQAAQATARAEGFDGQVAVTIETLPFDQRSLDGLTIPAGTYPALMIRLGDAQGQNWWGLIDPELALQCAEFDEALLWDWSLHGFLRALLGDLWEVMAHE
ncbi:MAG: stage II sporulation protein R [Clostridia bacterium]|nr:stage II sporulation protein R [Clostridia bacterium]